MAVEGKSETTMRRRLRLGMVGGGPGAFIGGVHRMASRLDGHYELVAGEWRPIPARARAGAATVGIAPDRAYGNFEEMVAGEEDEDSTASMPLQSSPRISLTMRRPRPFSGPVFTPSSATNRSRPQLATALDLGRNGQEHRDDLRPYAQLHWLSNGPAGSRDGRCRRGGQGPAWCRVEYAQDWAHYAA